MVQKCGFRFHKCMNIHPTSMSPMPESENQFNFFFMREINFITDKKKANGNANELQLKSNRFSLLQIKNEIMSSHKSNRLRMYIAHIYAT